MNAPAIDLVCWDFGDTLVHERFMRRCPLGVPQWDEIYDRAVDSRPGWEADWMLGRAAALTRYAGDDRRPGQGTKSFGGV